MTRELPEKRPRDDDLPAFDVEAARRRMLDAVWNGAPAHFVAMVDGLGLDIDPALLAREVFSGYEAAARVYEVIDHFRPGAMAKVMTTAEHIERALAGARAAMLCANEGEIVMSRIIDFTRRYGELDDDPLRRDLRDIVAEIEAWRDLLAKARAALDGRGAARTRMRLFANELAPRFFELCPRTLRGAPAFEQFIRAAVELMTGSCPNGGLVRSVSREIAALR